MFLGNPITEAQAEIGLRIGDVRVGVGDRPDFVIDRRPDFVYLQDQGFSVSTGGPYDIIYFGDRYYLYRDGRWYRAAHYRGPWDAIREHNLPRGIRRYAWEDIRRYRDIEYRRHDRRYWEERHERERDGDRNRDRDRHDRRDR